MPKRKLARKELKKPDEFLTWTARTLRFLREKWQLALALALIIVALAAGAWGWRQYQEGYEARAAIKFSQALQSYEEATFTRKPPPGKLEGTVKAFEEVVNRYPRSQFATISLLYIGNSLYQMGRYDEAVAAYKKVAEKGKVAPDIRALALSSLGYIYESKGDLTSASNYFRQVVALGPSFLQEEALLSQARTLEGLGKASQAAQTYRELISRFPNSTRVGYARQRLARLGG